MEVPLFKTYWEEDDVEAVSAAIRRGMHWANGPEIERFESGLSAFVGTVHAVVFSSGTAALHATLLVEGIGHGDEVIVPSFTFVSTANAVVMTGAKPVFADIEEEGFGLDPVSVEAAITERTRAVVPVHYAGRACRAAEIAEVCAAHDVLLVEDAAESLGATVGGRSAGTFGDAAMLSFCSNKVVSTGEGGAIVTDDDTMAARLRLVRSHGRDDEAGDYFTDTASHDYVTLGYNYRMPTMVAALGVSQLAKAERMISMRREAATRYGEALAGLGLGLPGDPEGGRHVYQLYTVVLPDEAAARRDAVQAAMGADGVGTKVYFDPVHLTTYYRSEHGGAPGQLPVTERLSDRVLSLPMYPGITEEEIEHVAGSLRRAMAG